MSAPPDQGKAPTEEAWRRWARAMVRTQIEARGVRDPAILRAMGDLPRHRFVPDLDPVDAYDDRALPTAQGQTISQPYIVALMTELLEVQPGMKVLEIGAGSGYQAAILAHLGARVVGVERAPCLAHAAAAVLGELGHGGAVTIHVGDGTRGWPAAAPYDRIIVTAGAPRVPQALRDQLVDGGRIVLPLGGRDVQDLVVVTRDGPHWRERYSVGCRFVPLIGADGWPDAG